MRARTQSHLDGFLLLVGKAKRSGDNCVLEEATLGGIHEVDTVSFDGWERVDDERSGFAGEDGALAYALYRFKDLPHSINLVKKYCNVTFLSIRLLTSSSSPADSTRP